MIDRDDIKTRFPNVFTDADDDVMDACIAEAVLLIQESKWGDFYDIGLLYLSAHLIVATTPDQADAGDAGAGGPVTSRRVGDVAVTYGSTASASSSSSASADDFNSTVYGRRYLQYRRMLQGGPFVAEPTTIVSSTS